MNRTEVAQILKEKGLSITSNRVDIINCLDDGYHFHAISEIIKHTNNKINTKSIYNNINALINVGIVDSYSFGGVSKYALNDHLFGSEKQVHIISPHKQVSHVEVNEKVFAEINKAVEKSGKKVRSVKIFVDTF